MGFKIINSYLKGNDIVYYKNKKILIDAFGVHFFSVDGIEEDSIIDFFNGNDAEIVMDHFLLVRNVRAGFKLYDVENKKESALLLLSDNEFPGENGYFIKGDKLYILYGSLSNKLMDLFMLDDDDNKKDVEEKHSDIGIYSLKDFSLIEKESYPVELKKIYYVPFSEKVYGVDADSNLFELVDKKATKLENVHVLVENLLVHPNKKEIYLQSLTGVRVYDENFKEINKVDIIEDYLSSSKYNDSSSILEITPGFDAINKCFDQKHTIHHVDFYDDDHFICLKSMNLGGYFSLEILDIAHGKMIKSMPIGMPMESLKVFPDKKILMKMASTLMMIEVEA